MVAQITSGTAFDKQGRPFRRRNYLPGILTLAVLAVITLMVWVTAFNRPNDVNQVAAGLDERTRDGRGDQGVEIRLSRQQHVEGLETLRRTIAV